jgi:hypothetical protein
MDDWRLLSDCLPAWLSAETGKDAGTEAPASEGPRQREEKPDGANRDRMNAALPMGRNMNLAPTTRSPGAAKFIFLVIDNEGGRTETGGNTSVRPIRSANPGGRGACRYLKLVWSDGADHAALANLAARRRPNRLFVGI